MAKLTKQQQAEFDALREQRAIERAMRFTRDVEPDVPIPSGWEMSSGYIPIVSAFSIIGLPLDVEEACSSAVSHGLRSKTKTSTQGAKRLYSTRLLALMAGRRTLELTFAKRLALADRAITEEIVRMIERDDGKAVSER